MRLPGGLGGGAGDRALGMLMSKHAGTRRRLDRRIIAALVALAAWANPAAGGERPTFASLNLCTDQLLLAIADAPQILGLSVYSHDPARSWFAEEAARFPRLSGDAEDVLVRRPDIVLSSRFSKGETRDLLRDKGLRVLDFDAANTVAEIEDQVRQVGSLSGHADRAATIVARLDAAVARTHAAASRKPARVLAVSRRGWIAGSDSLATAMLAAAGLANAASEIGVRWGTFASLETIVQLRPDLIMVSDDDPHAEDQGRAFLMHPALEQLYPTAKRLVVPERLTVCGGPTLVEALDRLTAELERVGREP